MTKITPTSISQTQQRIAAKAAMLQREAERVTFESECVLTRRECALIYCAVVYALPSSTHKTALQSSMLRLVIDLLETRTDDSVLVPLYEHTMPLSDGIAARKLREMLTAAIKGNEIK